MCVWGGGGVTVGVSVCVCVCVYVRERERERVCVWYSLMLQKKTEKKCVRVRVWCNASR